MGVKPIYKLETEDGKKIRTTGNHPYLTKYGWVRVADLGEGDEIAIPNSEILNSINILGLSGFNFGNKNALSIFPVKNYPPVANSKAINLNSISSSDKFSKSKWVRGRKIKFNLSNNSLLVIFGNLFNLLSGYLRKIIRNHVFNYHYSPNSFLTFSPLTLPDLRDSSISSQNSGLEYSRYSNKSSTASVKRLITSLGTGATLGNVLLDKVVFAIQNHYKRLKEWLSSQEEILWDKIIAIEYAGIEQVYDISVKNTHNFIGNDIIAHNTYISATTSLMGNVGIGTTTPSRLLTIDAGATSTIALGVRGSANFMGVVNQNTDSVDIAEAFPINPQCLEIGNCPEPGEVVSIRENQIIEKAFIPYDSKLIGVISSDPGFIMQGGLEPTSSRLVALAGRVLVKVSTENGPISIGDALTSSNIPGVAMKATKAGRVIGMALESLSEADFENCEIENSLKIENCKLKIGKVMVFVNPHWFAGSLAEDGSLASGESPETRPLTTGFIEKIKQVLVSLGLFIENGIAKVKELIVERILTKQICIEGDDGETICLNKNQLKELLQKSNLNWDSSSTSTSTPACTPNWQCTDWQPAPETIACGETFTQTRECTDLNNCETQDGKPSESQEVIGIKDCSPTLNE